MKKVLILESPGKIKTIKKILGSDFQILSTMGHIKDLPTKTMGITRNPIEIEYVTIEDKDKTIASLCKAAQGADIVYIAPDPDREGEIIAWHVAEELKKVVKKSTKLVRVTFNEITKSAVLEGIAHPYQIDMQKVAAQQARRVLDRWVGYEVSPILWKKITKGLSAGRVQSVALKLICEREIAIRNFKEEEYWSIHGTFKHTAGTITATLTSIGTKKAEIGNQKDADAAVAGISKESFTLEAIQDKKRTKHALPPFMTSTLQQAAYNRLGLTVEKTMRIAQNLYEGLPLQDGSPVALITYMRTDSLRVADSALTQARSFISSHFGSSYLPKSANVFEKKTKSAKGTPQDAHEAVRPVDVSIHPDAIKAYVTPEQFKVYELIWKRFVASQMMPAEYAQRQLTLKGGKYTFKTTGSTLLFDGFLKVYQDDSQDDESEEEKELKLPEGLAEKDPLTLKKVDPKQHFTQAPPRYSEASIIKELEKEGIGRPSTFVAILKTIRARAYTTLEKKRFIPTELGMTVTKMLSENLPKIMDKNFTALMEEDLDKIAAGDMDRDTLLNEFYTTFEADLKQFKGDMAKEAQPTDVVCPECKKHKLVIRFGKAGEFLGCPGYPDCSFTSNFIRNTADNSIELAEKEKPLTLDIMCPQCGKPLREMMGRFGKFIACSGYPDCKYIHQNKAGFACPQDGGDVVERKWKGGTFWGCKNYPKCKFALFGDIEETPCPKCKAPALLKKVSSDGTVTLTCADKNCGYQK